MRSVNKVLLMGYLAADPDSRVTESGINITKFKVATNRDWKTSDGEKQQATDYHKITAWRKLGEICAQYLKKGTGVYVEGRLMNHSFEDKDGEKKFFTEVVADNVNFISHKNKSNKEEVNLIEVS
ncbi:single-stranded DNA-binding protein [Pseudomonadota bacterium]